MIDKFVGSVAEALEGVKDGATYPKGKGDTAFHDGAPRRGNRHHVVSHCGTSAENVGNRSRDEFGPDSILSSDADDIFAFICHHD